jgi:hypothetical protein
VISILGGAGLGGNSGGDLVFPGIARVKEKLEYRKKAQGLRAVFHRAVI